METGWRKGVFLCNRQCFRIHSADIQALLTFKLSDVFLSCIYVTWKESTVDMFTSYKHICTHTLLFGLVLNNKPLSFEFYASVNLQSLGLPPARGGGSGLRQLAFFGTLFLRSPNAPRFLLLFSSPAPTFTNIRGHHNTSYQAAALFIYSLHASEFD